MARSDHLPIYRASYDLCLWFEQVVRGFGRFHKFSIGSDLRDGSRHVLRLVVRANARAARKVLNCSASLTPEPDSPRAER